MSWEASEDDVLRFIEAMTRREVGRVASLFAEDLRFAGGPRFGAPVVGREAFEGLVQRFFDELVELLLTPRGSFFDLNEAVAVLHLVGTLSPRRPSDPEGTREGRRVAWTGVYRFAFEEAGPRAGAHHPRSPDGRRVARGPDPSLRPGRAGRPALGSVRT